MTADAVTLVVVQVVLAALTVWSVVYWLATRGGGKAVNRAEESRRKFGVAYGFGSVILLQVINASAAFVGYKSLLSLVDVLVLSRL